MITLCGMCLSNYYNKVKMVLLEKGMPFEEEFVRTGSKEEAVLSCSPLAKVPFIRTAQGSLCESQAIVDYLEALQPEPRLLPADPWAAAKVRELTTFVDLHLELAARELYGKAFFGGEISEANAERVRKLLNEFPGATTVGTFGLQMPVKMNDHRPLIFPMVTSRESTELPPRPSVTVRRTLTGPSPVRFALAAGPVAVVPANVH